MYVYIYIRIHTLKICSEPRMSGDFQCFTVIEIVPPDICYITITIYHDIGWWSKPAGRRTNPHQPTLEKLRHHSWLLCCDVINTSESFAIYTANRTPQQKLRNFCGHTVGHTIDLLLVWMKTSCILTNGTLGTLWVQLWCDRHRGIGWITRVQIQPLLTLASCMVLSPAMGCQTSRVSFPTVPPGDHFLHHQLIPRNAGHPPCKFQDGRIQPATILGFSCKVGLLCTGAMLPGKCPSVIVQDGGLNWICTFKPLLAGWCLLGRSDNYTGIMRECFNTPGSQTIKPWTILETCHQPRS